MDLGTHDPAGWRSCRTPHSSGCRDELDWGSVSLPSPPLTSPSQAFPRAETAGSLVRFSPPTIDYSSHPPAHTPLSAPSLPAYIFSRYIVLTPTRTHAPSLLLSISAYCCTRALGALGTLARPWNGHGGGHGQVRAVQALPDGRLASASQDHTARLWTPKDGAAQGASGVYYDIGGK